MKSSADILSQLIAFDTVSKNPNIDLMDYVSELLGQAGVEARLIPDETRKKANLYATIGPQNIAGIMLSGHTDVVPVDGQDWTKPAFKLTEEGGRYFGRGTADMKGFVACALSAALTASKRELKTPLHLALSYDEEIGCVGVRSMIAMFEKAPTRPAMCIVGEPTSLAVATGHKGKTALRATCIGQEVHSALAPHGLNALYLGCDFVNILRELQSEIALSGPQDDDYDITYTTIHAGIMKAGLALNIVPKQCQIDFEIRNIASDDPASIIETIGERADQLISTARQTYSGADIVIEVMNAYPGLDTPVDSNVVRFVQSLTGANTTNKVAFGSEGGLFSTELGIPTVVCGPGSMAQGHKPDEYIEVEQMRRCNVMLETLLDRLVEGI